MLALPELLDPPWAGGRFDPDAETPGLPADNPDEVEVGSFKIGLKMKSKILAESKLILAQNDGISLMAMIKQIPPVGSKNPFRSVSSKPLSS